jgi:hypothetical protein
LNPLLIAPAYAQTEGVTATEAPEPKSRMEYLKPYIMVGVILAITVLFFICIGLFCIAKDSEKIKFAHDMIRTIVGFYIGIFTGLLGLPA